MLTWLPYLRDMVPTRKESRTIRENKLHFLGHLSKRCRRNKIRRSLVSFARRFSHMKKAFTKYVVWREKKCVLLNFVSSEINLAIVPFDTWWIDTGATTHIIVTMQGCLRSRMPTDGERYIYVGNGNCHAPRPTPRA